MTLEFATMKKPALVVYPGRGRGVDVAVLPIL